MVEDEFDEIWELVKNSTPGVAPPWKALKEFYCQEHPHPFFVIDSLTTAEELGFIKEVGHLQWRLTVKGYRMAERLWGPKEKACECEPKRPKPPSIWGLLGG